MLEQQLDRIIELLEIIVEAFAPHGCPHEDAIDVGTMGMKPGAKMLCKNCGANFSRIDDDEVPL